MNRNTLLGSNAHSREQSQASRSSKGHIVPDFMIYLIQQIQLDLLDPGGSTSLKASRKH